MKRYLTTVVAALLAISVAQAAIAADVCVADGAQQFIFKKVKKLKAGAVVPLTGVHLNGALVVPFSGSAVMKADGVTVQAGIFVHTGPAGTNFTMGWTTTTALAGFASYDNNGDYLTDSGPLVLTTVDCSTIVIP